MSQCGVNFGHFNSNIINTHQSKLLNGKQKVEKIRGLRYSLPNHKMILFICFIIFILNSFQTNEIKFISEERKQNSISQENFHLNSIKSIELQLSSQEILMKAYIAFNYDDYPIPEVSVNKNANMDKENTQFLMKEYFHSSY